jgi:epoxyqueuosine reductase
MVSGREDISYTESVKKRVLGLGAHVVGVADLRPFHGQRAGSPELLEPFHRAISIAVRVPRAVFETISDRPTAVYAKAYLTANRILDDIAFRAAVMLEQDGHKALPIPASQVLDRENWLGAVSHKAVGRMAGVGWQGKSLLLVNPLFGPRIRLATILTDADLLVDGPIKNRCGSCVECRDACPAQAIKGVSTNDRYADRNEAVILSKCVSKVVGEFSNLPEVGASICGICIKACPFGQRVR